MVTIKPTIHLNGDRAETLVDQYLDVRTKLGEALDALYQSGPNGRNFYVQGDEAFTTARKEHDARTEAVRGVIADIDALLEHCAEFVK